MSYLGNCRFCDQPVFQLTLKTGPSGLNDIDWRPWSIEDETPPTTQPTKDGDKPITAATLKRWREERPYRLGLVVVDLQQGTYQAATHKARGKLIHGDDTVMHRLHWCEEKEKALYGGRYK